MSWRAGVRYIGEKLVRERLIIDVNKLSAAIRILLKAEAALRLKPDTKEEEKAYKPLFALSYISKANQDLPSKS